MKRRDFLKNTSLAAAGGMTLLNLPALEENRPISFVEENDFKSSFVRISKENPYYFELSDGNTYIPVGPNICFARDLNINTMVTYIQRLAENGGNYLRIWLSHPIFEYEKTDGKGINTEAIANVDKIFELAGKYNIKIKLCLHHFRQISSNKAVPDKVNLLATFDKPGYFKGNGGHFNNMSEYINSETGRKMYLDRVEFFRNRYGNNPAVFGWELWNEINAIECENILEWNEYMLAMVHKKFPENLVMQNLGSFDTDKTRNLYQSINSLSSNDVAQIHRYLDQGASLDVCKGPMDILTSDAIDELRSYKIVKPMLLAESGAVEPKHSAPSKLYLLDKDGILLHDILFAPFFSGAAGPGMAWHWDSYIDKNNLWFHYQRFNESIKGIDPVKEKFIPLKKSDTKLNTYILAGEKNHFGMVPRYRKQLGI